MTARGLSLRDTRSFVEIVLDVVDHPAEQLWSGLADSRFHLYLYPSEWSFFFCHDSRASWIRVADRPTVHGRDDYNLVYTTPRLVEIATFIRSLEDRYRILFRREHALVRTNLDDPAEAVVRAWLLQT